MKWADEEPEQRSRKYLPKLQKVREHQKKHPGKWAEIGRFKRRATASETAVRLRKEHLDFEFRAQKEQKTGDGVLYARLNGTSDTLGRS